MTAKQNFEMSSDMLPSEADRLLDSNSHKVWHNILIVRSVLRNIPRA
jgi:hypothetical protein